MKDEEMAEKSLISYRKEPKWTGKLFMRDEDTCYKDGFLAGLKAGRPQWHDLSEQIPTEKKIYLVAIKGNGLAIAYFNGKHWETKYNLGDFGHIVCVCPQSSPHFIHIGGCVETVIAWCEIPTFDKE